MGHLGHAIAGRGRVLLVLDNFEQVVEHAPSTVGRWLEVAPEAVFLVTSREPLRLSAEQVLPLEPLPEQDGVALFELRARAADASWEESEENRAAIHRIVEQLDGLPLAIELAAARARLLSPTQLLGRLSDRFKLLRGGRRGDTARQATLAGLIHWSWELLDPWEQAALAQLSVFRGGFFMEAAEEVLDLSAWPDAPWSLDVVGSLFDKSLLRSWKVRGQPRFGMYLSIRDYAAEKLDSLPDPANNPRHAAAVRHAAFYAGSGSEEAIDALQSHGGVERRKALALDLENLVRGVQAAGAAAEPELAACCALAAAEVFQFQGPFSDGVALLQGLLDQSVCPGTRERLYRSGGDLLRNVGRKEEAYEYFRQALAIAREVGNRRGEGRALDLLGLDVYQGGRIAEALEHYQQTLAIHREVGDRVLEGRAIGRIGYIYREQGLRAEALDYARQAIGIYREVGARHEEGVALANLAILHQEVGEFPESGELRQQALAIHRELGDRRSEGIVLGNLAVAHQMQGELDEAVEYFHRSLAIHRELGNRRFEALDSGNLGDLLFARDDLESAESHLLEATLILDELWPAAAGAFRATLALIRARQGAFDEARSLLATGETQLRGIHKTEFGKLLCRRAQVEHLAGDAAAFMRALAEAESIAAESGSGAESELGRSIVELRALLGD